MTAEPASVAPGRQSPARRERRWTAWLAVAVLAAALRGLYPTADPPWRATVGVVWHDEGAWTHNARNRALWGTWRTDDWNPLYVAPVFTGLEYAAFAAFGVGTWQARLVPMTLGVIAVIALGCGVARIGGRRAGIAAAILLATNYVGAMYDRAAIMEGADGGGHRRQLVGVRQGAGAAGLGRRRRRRGHRGLFHQGGGGVLRRRDRPHGTRGGRLPGLGGAVPATAPWTERSMPARRRTLDAGRPRRRRVIALVFFVGPEWANTASTTGRCRSPASRPTTRSRC